MDRIEAAIEGNLDDLPARGRTVAATYGSWHDAIGRQVAVYQAKLDGHANAEAPGLPARRDPGPYQPSRSSRAVSGIGGDITPDLSPRPEFHGVAAADESGEFVSWCRRPRSFHVQWLLHGYSHRDDGGEMEERPRLTAAQRLAARFLTGGEGEFLQLRGDALRARLEAGMQTFSRCLGVHADGFVAPAWLFNEELIPALARAGLRFTENHRHLFDVQAGRRRESPVITWATRTRLRRYGSLIVSGSQRRLWSRAAVLRIALHPHDFDHPATVSSIARTLDAARRDRELASTTGACLKPDPLIGTAAGLSMKFTQLVIECRAGVTSLRYVGRRQPRAVVTISTIVCSTCGTPVEDPTSARRPIAGSDVSA